jgi:orotidine-5'-phosphate decarboxylase
MAPAEGPTPAPPAPRDRLIVALDVPGLAEAEALVDRLGGTVARVKIGSQLFSAAGPAAVEAMRRRGLEVFLDLKFHDIPSTVAGAAAAATRLGVFMFDVHAGGGPAMMAAAAQAAAETARGLGRPRPLVLAVTVLTSLDRAGLALLGATTSLEGQVLHLAQLARDSGLDGCVASPNEIAPLRRLLGPRWTIVTPGVRPAGSDAGDQARVATPAAAARAGAHYLVVGRPVIAAADPARAARAILEEMAT